MKRVIAYLDELWFSPVPASRLAWLRVVVGGYASYFLHTRRDSMVNTAGGSAEVFRPIGVTSFMAEPISPELYDSIIGATLMLGYCFAFGFWHRVLAPIFAFSFLWVITYSTSWSMVFHTENMLVLHVLILALSPSANAVSVDSDLTEDYPTVSPRSTAS